MESLHISAPSTAQTSTTTTETAPETSATFPALDDVWMSVICPMLEGVDIIRFSMVNKWARKIAHAARSHKGYVFVQSMSVQTYRDFYKCWPFLKLESRFNELELSQPDADSNTRESLLMIGKLHSLSLFGCKTSNFEFLDPTKTEMLGLYDTTLSYEGAESLGAKLLQAKSLTSLRLCYGTLSSGALKALAKPIGHVTQLVDLSLRVSILDEAAACCLAEPLSQLKRLERLDLGL
eukprot:c10601_g1_i3.p1 GENE.c10601_g1_i3~~c10601_g1_i3.p1  ORF type:complete len:247 (+),score=40.47 c10601_g1_i3:35-742(+)